MLLLDAHLGYLLIALAVLAVALGITAHVLAARLLLGLDRPPANDPVYRRACRTPARRAGRGRLTLAA